MWRVWMIAIVAACGAQARPSTEHRFTNNWGNGLGCTPVGDELTLIGAVVVRPFGKGTDGALLATDAGDWVVSYRASDELLDLDGKRVRARGRACEMQGESVAGKHLDLASLEEL